MKHLGYFLALLALVALPLVATCAGCQPFQPPAPPIPVPPDPGPGPGPGPGPVPPDPGPQPGERVLTAAELDSVVRGEPESNVTNRFGAPWRTSRLESGIRVLLWHSTKADGSPCIAEVWIEAGAVVNVTCL